MRKTVLNFRRLLSLSFYAEGHKVLRDKGVMLILVGAMIIYPVIYSIAYQNNVLYDIDMVVVDSDPISAFMDALLGPGKSSPNLTPWLRSS